MLQIERIKLQLHEQESLLTKKAAAVLRVSPGEIWNLQVFRRSVDARDGVHLV